MVPIVPRGNWGFISLQILVEFCRVRNLLPCSKQRGLSDPPVVTNKNHNGLNRLLFLSSKRHLDLEVVS